ncbi:23 kDa integral membrane protein-like [Amyelois transitella]|uniref:23 kDa integral membrane protein-like n=1 Tax=Amyelois transitella TaxID=680683 RepID=UPI00298FFE30|nr:23 kDa integral membrane protein-like [Amyelois transitella]
MGSKVCSHVLNSIYAFLGLALTATAIWFFVEVKEVTNLRNSNHYLLDYNLYWPQVIPWLFIIVGLLVLGVSGCGFSGATKKSKGLLRVHVTFVSITILVSLAVAVIALVFADSKSSDNFIKDTIWDAFYQMKEHHEVEESFGRIERRMQCCGAESPRDYVNWKNDFPNSCCDVFYHGWLEPYSINCEITNKLANERHGCAAVAAQYSRIIIKVLSGVSIFIAFISIIILVVSIKMLRSILRRPRVIQAQQESESKKGLI